jgi:hypothetical protein
VQVQTIETISQEIRTLSWLVENKDYSQDRIDKLVGYLDEYSNITTQDIRDLFNFDLKNELVESLVCYSCSLLRLSILAACAEARAILSGKSPFGSRSYDTVVDMVAYYNTRHPDFSSYWNRILRDYNSARDLCVVSEDFCNKAEDKFTRLSAILESFYKDVAQVTYVIHEGTDNADIQKMVDVMKTSWQERKRKPILGLE